MGMYLGMCVGVVIYAYIHVVHTSHVQGGGERERERALLGTIGRFNF